MSGGAQVARRIDWPWIVAGLAAVVAVGSVGWAVSRSPERVEVPVVEPDPADRAEIAELEEAVAEREDEIRGLMERLADLELKRDAGALETGPDARPSVALAECRQERERLREGLRKAVDELNARNIAIRGAGGAPPVSATSTEGAASGSGRGVPSSPQQQGPEPYRKISSYADRIQIVGEKAVVSGRLYNPDERDQRVEVELALLRDGEEVQSRTQTVLVPGRGHLTVSDRLHVGGIDGSYTGRVRVLD